MARPRKDGLDYFPLDVNFLSDLKIKKIIRAYGAQAVAVVISALTTIYRDNGYFATYDEDLIFIIADELKLEDSYVKDVIEKLIEVDFLNKEQKEKNNILTSIGIQERYLKVCERRVKTTLNATYNLLNNSSNELPQTESTPEGSFCKQKPLSTGVNDSKSTQSKVNKNKVNKNKINNNLVSSEKNSDVRELIEMYQENFGVCNSLVIHDLEKSLGYLDKDAIIESFRLSLGKDNPYLYMKGIWAKWKENGIKTYAQVKYDEEKHKQNRTSYKPKGYVEIVPDWAME